MVQGGDGEFLDALLRYWRSEDDAERAEISSALWARHGREASVLVLDMSGFSRISESHGIVHYLAMVRRMQLTAEPIIESYEGEVVKFVADNCFALFGNPWHALQAALTLNHAFEASNLVTDDVQDIWISCGVDHGRLLVVEGDLFGDPVNRACRLGEDVGAPGQVLVTAEAMALVPYDAGISGEPMVVDQAGVVFEAVAVHYEEPFDSE